MNTRKHVSIINYSGDEVPLTKTEQDQYYERYTSANGDYSWEIWRGEATPNFTSQKIMDDLGNASLEDATNESKSISTEETVSFNTLPDPKNTEILAISLTTPEERLVGTPTPKGTWECKRQNNEERTSITVQTGKGTLILPSQSAKALSTTKPWYYYTHSTFIQPSSASAPLCGTFKGDNRSWGGGSSRTFVSVRADWAKKTLTQHKSVSTTHRTSWPQAKKTASSTGIRFTGAVASNSYLRIEIAHSVGNPLCGLAGPIQYNDIVQIWKSGAVIVYTKGIQVPNHEMYVYRTNGYRATVARLKAKDFICLTVGFPLCNAKFSQNKTIR